MSNYFKGCWVTSGILLLLKNKRITSTEAFILGMVWSLSNNPQQVCRASNAYFVRILGIHKDVAKRLIRRLERKNLIYREVGHRSRTLRLRKWLHDKGGLKVPPIYTSTKYIHNKGGSERAACVDQIDLECCKHLKKAIHSKIGRVQRWSNTKQATHFSILRRKLKDDDLFLSIFEWYVEHWHETESCGLPQCYDPHHITREKVWSWIEREYKKQAPREKKVKISNEAKAIVKTLMMRQWPKGSEKQLPMVVQVSLDEYKRFMDKLRQAMFQTEDDEGLRRVVRYLKQKLPPAWSFVENWFRELNDQIHGWDKWGGDLYAQRFTTDSKRFKHYGRDLTVQYNGRAKDWDKLMELINEK